jgi:hypothetical protein
LSIASIWRWRSVLSYCVSAAVSVWYLSLSKQAEQVLPRQPALCEDTEKRSPG